MAGQPTVPGPRYEALLQLLRTAETLWNTSRLFFDRWDLGPSQFNLLNALSGSPEGLSQSELSRRLVMHRSNVTGLVTRLASRGLVIRQSFPEDRRAYRVLLTLDGRKLLQRVLPHYHMAAEEVWGEISARRAKSLLAELRQLGSNAERMVDSRCSRMNFSEPS